MTEYLWDQSQADLLLDVSITFAKWTVYVFLLVWGPFAAFRILTKSSSDD